MKDIPASYVSWSRSVSWGYFTLLIGAPCHSIYSDLLRGPAFYVYLRDSCFFFFRHPHFETSPNTLPWQWISCFEEFLKIWTFVWMKLVEASVRRTKLLSNISSPHLKRLIIEIGTANDHSSGAVPHTWKLCSYPMEIKNVRKQTHPMRMMYLYVPWINILIPLPLDCWEITVSQESPQKGGSAIIAVLNDCGFQSRKVLLFLLNNE